MKKIFYCVGIYATCAFIHDAVKYAWEPIDIAAHKVVKKQLNNLEDDKRRSVNLSDKSKSGKIIDKIGF